jgi:hypothetical protein
MRQISLAFLFVYAVSASVTAQSKLRERIPAPKEKVYRTVLSGKDWKNPVLGVNEDGVVRMKTGEDYGAAAVVVPVTEALSWLEVLPLRGLRARCRGTGSWCLLPFCRRRKENCHLLDWSMAAPRGNSRLAAPGVFLVAAHFPKQGVFWILRFPVWPVAEKRTSQDLPEAGGSTRSASIRGLYFL